MQHVFWVAGDIDFVHVVFKFKGLLTLMYKQNIACRKYCTFVIPLIMNSILHKFGLIILVYIHM